MSNRVITISREFGSQGRTIGKQVAAKLGIPCYDAELLEQIAEHGKYTVGGSRLAQVFPGREDQGHSVQDDLWAVQQKIITELAEKESCVIVEMCADYILKDKVECLRVFIYADMESRSKRIVEQYGERCDFPEKRLKDEDERRAAYYQFYTDMKWGDPHNYHITLNSGELGIEKCVDIITKLYHSEDEVCPCCERHCPKSNLHCSRGRSHFGIQVGAHNHAGDRSGHSKEKMLTLLMKCGRFLHHDVSQAADTAQLIDVLTADERKTLEALLEKCLNSWQDLGNRNKSDRG